MSSIVLGCDSNGVNDAECRDTIAEILEKAGNEVEKLGIAPGPFADYSYSSKASGKIGVYIMADSIVSIADLVYGNTNFKYGYFVIRGDLGLPRMSTMEHFQNNPIRPDSDCTSVCDKLAGKSYGEMNEIIKDRAHIVFGTNPTEMGENLVKAMGGEVDSEDNTTTTTTSSIKESLKKACAHWDGDVEIRLIDDTVHVQKIQDPTKTRLMIDKYNCQYDSINVTEVNPNTVNYLSCYYDGYNLILSDESLIERFGKNAQEVEIDHEEITSWEEAESFLQREWNKIRRESGRSVELKIEGSMNFKQGVWCRVYLPEYFLDDYMYISKCAQEEDGTNNWTASLTLVDYPPSFGTEEEEENEDSTETTEAV